jgi:hypothetical protein
MVCVFDPSLMFPRYQFQLDQFPKRPFPQGISQHCSWMIVLTIDQLLSYMIVCSLGLLPIYSISPCWSCRSKGRIQVRVRNRMLLIAYTAVSTVTTPLLFGLRYRNAAPIHLHAPTCRLLTRDSRVDMIYLLLCVADGLLLNKCIHAWHSLAGGRVGQWRVGM